MRRLNQPYCRATRWNPTEDRRPETPLVGELRRTLGALLTLELVTRRAHWSVTGPSFQGLHELFDDVYKETAGWVDLVAERVRQLGESIEGIVPQQGPPPGPVDGGPGRAQASRVATALEDAIAPASRAAVVAEGLHDQASVDVLAEVIRGAEKRLWFVRSHLEPAGLRFNGPVSKRCDWCNVMLPIKDLRRFSDSAICKLCYREIQEAAPGKDFDAHSLPLLKPFTEDDAAAHCPETKHDRKAMSLWLEVANGDLGWQSGPRGVWEANVDRGKAIAAANWRTRKDIAARRRALMNKIRGESQGFDVAP